MASKYPELVGLSEIAKLAGVKKQAVYQWIKRSHNMPEPIARLDCGPIWDGAAIRAWLVKLGFTHVQR